MRIGLPTVLLLLVFLSPAKAGESRTTTGRVLDENGNPVQGAAIDEFWRANGSAKDQDGKPIDPATEEGNKLFWSHVGQMEPQGVVRSGSDGRFSFEMPDHSFMLMAMDAQRLRGGLATIPKEDDGAKIEIRLRPLVRVKGTIEGPAPGQKPSWTHVYTQVPEDPTRPLDSCRLVSCGSYEANFMMSLPPGRYVLDAYNFRLEGKDERLDGRIDKEIVLTGDTAEIDLGVIMLSRVTRLNINQKIKQSQASGAMGDYTKRYGEKLPAWNIVDARGVSKDVQLADFRGKWVLVDFWAVNCSACLMRDLPKLAKFYDDHKSQCDRFEILAICIDCDEKMKSIAEVDQALEPIVKHVWGGKPLPFPLLLDPSMTTLERFGVPGYETILIDPDGRLVKGGESTLAERLKEKRP
jgi:thiol-disulfide isomerase/thioredoxin